MAKAAGIEPRLHYNEMNVMGFSEVFRKLPQLLKHLKIAKSLLSEFRPDVLILVDYPSFNLKLAKAAKAMGIPVHYFISPKIWAWKEFRIKAIKRDVDAMYSILPFEVAYYKKHDYKVTYVGNPSVQEMDYALGHMPPIKHFFERQGITDQRRIIALLPGSRKGEIRNNLPLMIEAAKRFPEFQYIVAAAPTIPLRFYRQVAQDPGLNVVFGCTPMLVKHATAALVTSGTATLETALLGTPQVVCYRSNGKRLAYKIMEKLLKVKYVSLPNLILGNEIVPELLVHRCTVESISRNLTPLLVASPQRDWQIGGYKAMRRKLGTQSAADYAALLICQSLGVEIDSTTLEEPSAPKKRRRPRPKPTDAE
jgi:lipid-A-disaccharide synthase